MTPEQRLMDAIVNCRIYQTKHLLWTGAPAEFLDDEGYSPLLRACEIEDQKHRTRTNLIKLLIEYGADVNTTDPRGHHALAQACLSEKQDIVHLLLDTSMHNIDFNKSDHEGDTPLMHVVRNGNIEIVKLLVDSMNKFHIDMHVRNHADRTPYLEAVRLGRNDCAKILLEEGHASTNVQVNPFLDILTSKQSKYNWEGTHNGEQSVVGCERKYIGQGGLYDKVRHCKNNSAKVLPNTRGDITLSTTLSYNTHKRLPKRKTVPVKSLKKRNKVKTENVSPLSEIQCGQNSDSVDTGCPKLDSYLATDTINTSGEKDNQARRRPHTALVSTVELERKKNGENYNLLTSKPVSKDDIRLKHRSLIPEHHRCKTAPPKRCNSMSSLATSSGDLSWHSHFTIHTSPSVNFLNKIMNLYAEQFSPESSYRKGVKPRNTEESNAPAIVEPVADEHDKRSDGRRSSSGSLRSITSGNRNRFSVLTRTVATCISSKKGVSGSKSKQ